MGTNLDFYGWGANKRASATKATTAVRRYCIHQPVSALPSGPCGLGMTVAHKDVQQE